MPLGQPFDIEQLPISRISLLHSDPAAGLFTRQGLSLFQTSMIKTSTPSQESFVSFG